VNFFKHLWAVRPTLVEALYYTLAEAFIVYLWASYGLQDLVIPFAVPFILIVAWVSAAFGHEDDSLDV